MLAFESSPAKAFLTLLTDSLANGFAHVLEGSHGSFLIFRGLASRADFALDLARVGATDEAELGWVGLSAAFRSAPQQWTT